MHVTEPISLAVSTTHDVHGGGRGGGRRDDDRGDHDDDHIVLWKQI